MTTVGLWKCQTAVYLGHRRWGFSANVASSLIMTYPSATRGTTSQTANLPAVGVFEDPIGYTEQSDDLVFQASFRKQI